MSKTQANVLHILSKKTKNLRFWEIHFYKNWSTKSKIMFRIIQRNRADKELLILNKLLLKELHFREVKCLGVSKEY